MAIFSVSTPGVVWAVRGWVKVFVEKVENDVKCENRLVGKRQPLIFVTSRAAEVEEMDRCIIISTILCSLIVFREFYLMRPTYVN